MKGLLSLFGLLAWAMMVVADEALFRNLTKQYKKQLQSQLSSHTSGCTEGNVAVRKEWGTLTKNQRKAYIKAVKCLQNKPSKAPAGLIPGSRSRFDDFQGVHIYEAFNVHFNGRFLPWHRYYVWRYEQVLRNECGYSGYQPYWEWSIFEDPARSPLFDGSETSMSGNGKSIPHDALVLGLPLTNLSMEVPPGTGGGCIYDGPFKDFKTHLGPSNYSTALGPAVGSGSGLDYNPRCIERDFNPPFARSFLTYGNITNLLTQSANYDELITNMEAGVHGAGHQTIGRSMGDLFASPGDPAFYFHHAQIDRMWSIWQSLKPAERQNQLLGYTTWFNIPPAPNITLSNPIGLWFEAEAKAAAKLTNTVEHQFCYIYE